VPTIKMYAPPPDPQDATAPLAGIFGWKFPEWFIVQEASATGDGTAFRSRPMVHRSALRNGKYFDRKRPANRVAA